MLTTIKEVITDTNFIGAIFSSLVFIFLGYFLRKKSIINDDGKKAITQVVLKIALPAMAFSTFMVDLETDVLVDQLFVFVLSLFLYILLIIIGKLIFKKFGHDKSNVMAILISVGQLTFFTIPLLKAIYIENVNDVLLPANMMTLAFRLILYIYCYLTIAKLSFNKANLKLTIKKIILNPIIIAMFLGIFIWLTQDLMPFVLVNDKWVSILRIDATVPYLFKAIDLADSLTTPLAMIVIGCILGEANFKRAITDKLAWIMAISRTILSPLLVLGLLLLIQLIGIINLNEYSLMVLVLGFAAPLSAVVSTYATTYDNHEELVSKTCLLSTVLCCITYPFLYVIIKLVLLLPIF